MAIQELDQGADRLVLQAELPRMTADQAFAQFVQPELLTRWWPAEAEVDARAGGWYDLSWPAQNWHLRGRYTIFEPGRALAFTWQWDHEPEQPMRHVAIDFAGYAKGSGCLLTVTHAVYGESAAEQEDRQSHRDGWQHFLGQLAELEPV